MDIKTYRKQSQQRKNKLVSRIPLSIRTDQMYYSSTWNHSALSSDSKTGLLADWYSFSIQNSSEYSILASLFTECRLHSASVHFVPTQSANGSVLHGLLMIGTNMAENINNSSTPASFTDVQNLQKVQETTTLDIRPFTYNMRVPRLTYSVISIDSPATSTPWAGSPGVVKVLSTPLTASTNYFQVHQYAVWELRGRN